MNLSTLTTRDGVDAALRTLTDARTLLGGSADLTQATDALTTLQAQLKSGDYIVLDPSGNGWGYVTCHYEAETGLKELVRGHTLTSSVAALALRLGQPVVIGSEPLEQWREQTARKLRQAGVIAITEMED